MRKEQLRVVEFDTETVEPFYNHVKLVAISSEDGSLVDSVEIKSYDSPNDVLLNAFRLAFLMNLREKGYHDIILETEEGAGTMNTIKFKEVIARLQDETGRYDLAEMADLLQQLIEVQIKQKHSVTAIEFFAELVLSEIEQ